MRLVKYLAQAGVASRRKSEDIIRSGRISVDDKVVFDPAYNVNEDVVITLDNKEVKLHTTDELVYVMFHKPVGIIATMSDEKANSEILSDIIKIDERVYPVGRLDKESSGLLMLTNDGELTHNMTHPRKRIEKEYTLKVSPALKLADFKKFKSGAEVDGRVVEIDKLESLSRNRVRIVIHEGRNRILRRLFGHLGYNVHELKRTRIGTLGLGTTPAGKWRYLTSVEVERLKMLVG